MPVVYEVNVALEPSIYQKYLAWLKPHVAEILALPGFTQAEVHQEEEVTDGTVHLTIHYQIDTLANLKRYLAEDAPRLRQDADKHFGGQFKAWRRVLTRIESLKRG